MRAALTGATGLLGGNLAIELLGRGVDVRCTRRPSSCTGHLAGFGIEWVEADLSSADRLAEVFEGSDVVFHCAADVRMRPVADAAMWATNIVGTENVVAAARRAGVARLVHCSSAVAVGIGADGPADEDVPWNFADFGLDDAYTVTKHESERAVLRAARAGVDAVVVNPTYMFGPYDAKPSSGRLITNVVRGRVPGTTPGTNSFVDVRDVAAGMVAAWQRGRRGERYLLGGENTGYRDIMERIAAVAGVRPPRRALPHAWARLGGLAGDVGQRVLHRELPLNSVTVRWGYCDRFAFRSDKAVAELGYRFRPVEEAIRDAIAWFRRAGML